ncbi:hypothetical protein Lal_00033010 [Lupinus albus]|nr:hypothetical protein Lal_00033010 [Lupinus albus]
MWRQALAAHEFRISRNKTEYTECKFSKRRTNSKVEIKVSWVNHRNREIDVDENHRIQVDWMKWRSASDVIFDKKVSLKLKGMFYYTSIRPTMLYGTECWAIKFNKRIDSM